MKIGSHTNRLEIEIIFDAERLGFFIFVYRVAVYNTGGSNQPTLSIKFAGRNRDFCYLMKLHNSERSCLHRMYVRSGVCIGWVSSKTRISSYVDKRVVLSLTCILLFSLNSLSFFHFRQPTHQLKF